MFFRGPVVVHERSGTAESALRSGKVTVAKLKADFEKFDAFKYPIDVKFDSARIEPRSASYFVSGNFIHSGKKLYFKGGGRVVGDEAMSFAVLSTSKAFANRYGSEAFLVGRQ